MVHYFTQHICCLCVFQVVIQFRTCRCHTTTHTPLDFVEHHHHTTINTHRPQLVNVFVKSAPESSGSYSDASGIDDFLRFARASAPIAFTPRELVALTHIRQTHACTTHTRPCAFAVAIVPR